MCLSPSAYEQSIERMHELPLHNYPRGGGVGGGELRSTPFSDPVPERKEGGVSHFHTSNMLLLYE